MCCGKPRNQKQLQPPATAGGSDNVSKSACAYSFEDCRNPSGVSISTILPADIKAMRDPSNKASRTSCVTKTTVLPKLDFSCANSFCKDARVKGSSAPKGSSIKSSGGSAAKARATPTRWR